MRELKFRAWDKEAKEMLNYSREVMQLMLTPFAQRYAIMQYSGLKDKQGTEIYEGDILNDPFTDVKPYVEFVDGSFCVLGYENCAVDLLEYLENSSVGTCVIGNIYEDKK